MLTTAKDIDQFLALQDKNEAQLRVIVGSLGLDPAGSKDDLINQIITNQVINDAYGVSKPQAISLRTSENAGASGFLREIRVLMYKFNKKKEFTLVNPKDIAYQQVMNYLPCEDEHFEKLQDMDMILAKPEQSDICNLLRSGISFHEFEINFINKPAANNKSFVMLHVKPV